MRNGMGTCRAAHRLTALAFLAIAWVPSVQGGNLYSATRVVSTGAAPVEQIFTPTAQQAGAVDVTVTDAAFPAALATLRVAVTQGATVLKSASATAGAPASLTLTFTAVAGVPYTVRLVGRPDPASGAGSALVSIAPSGQSNNPYSAFPATFQIPIASSAGNSLNVSQTISIPAAGDYQATLADLSLPAPMSFVGAALFQGAAQVGPPLQSGQTTTLTGLAAGDYTLRIVGVPSAAGALFSLRIQGGPGNAVVYPAAGSSGVTALGGVSAPVAVANPTAGTVTLGVTDLMLPGALAAAGAVLTDPNGALIARQCITACASSDPASGAAPAGSLQLWRFAAADAGGGSYLTTIVSGPTVLYADTRSVSAAASGPSTTQAFVFPFSVPSAGSYTVAVADVIAPAPLAGLQFAVFQGSTAIGSSATGGQITASLASGAAEIRVIAQLAAASGAGIFGVQVAPVAAPTAPLLATAQAVGAFSGTQTVTVPAGAAGVYAVSLTDAKWPAAFSTLDLFVTQGPSVIGKIYGAGSLPLTLAAGDYQLTYAALPDGTEAAGLYGLNVQSAAVPTVTLSASSTSVSSGQSVTLSWSTTGATSCTASGGWSGSQPTSGTAVSEGPLSLTTTFTLQCAGDGGNSVPASVTVTVTPASAAAGGGGGAVDGWALMLLCLLIFGRRFDRISSEPAT